MITRYFRLVCLAILVVTQWACETQRPMEPLEEPQLHIEPCFDPQTPGDYEPCTGSDDGAGSPYLVHHMDWWRWSYPEPDNEMLHEAPGDPNPSAPGVWLGNSTNPSSCYGNWSVSEDKDRDFFKDRCELEIARSFAPMMQFSTEMKTEYPDGSQRLCTLGEPHWAVTPFHGGTFVNIAYLPAYYADCGDGAAEIFDALGLMVNEHWGDSEFIRITVRFVPGSGHWIFRQAFLSAHFGASLTLTNLAFPITSIPLIITGGDRSEWVYADELEFPAGPRTFPVIWVARHKHANYKSHQQCETAGLGNLDACPGGPHNRNRFPVREQRNVGSPGYPLVVGKTSEHMIYTGPGDAPTECFFDCKEEFTGWVHDANTSSSTYYYMLRHLFARFDLEQVGGWWMPGEQWSVGGGAGGDPGADCDDPSMDSSPEGDCQFL